MNVSIGHEKQRCSGLLITYMVNEKKQCHLLQESVRIRLDALFLLLSPFLLSRPYFSLAVELALKSTGFAFQEGSWNRLDSMPQGIVATPFIW